jgi:hypothetical protein
MDTLPQHIVSHIGSFIENAQERSHCLLASKTFAAIHFNKNLHILTFTNATCVEKLENFERIYKFIKKVRPNLKFIKFVFLNCMNAIPFSLAPLNTINVDVAIIQCHCFQSLLKSLQTMDSLRNLFIGLTKNTIISNEDITLIKQSKAKCLNVHLYKNQLSLLTHNLSNLGRINIDLSCDFEMSTIIDLTNVKDTAHVTLLSFDMRVKIINPDVVSEIVVQYTDGGFFNVPAFKGLKKCIIMNINWQNMEDLDSLLSKIPKTTVLQICEEKSPQIVPLVKSLISKWGIVPEIVYAYNESYIISKIVKHYVPQVKCVPFSHANYPALSNYQPPEHLKSISKISGLYKFMSSEQQNQFWWLKDPNF